MNARSPAASERSPLVAIVVVATLAALVALVAGCEDPSLRVAVIRAPAYTELIERVEVSVYQREGLTCDDIAFDKLSAEEQRAILRSTGAGDLDAIPRLGRKAVVARGYGRASRIDPDAERLIIAGCAEVDEITDQTRIEIETEPVATVAIDTTLVPDGKGAVNIAVIAIDANQEGIDGKEVRWIVYGPAGSFPATGDISEPTDPVMLSGGDGVIRPAAPLLVGPYAVQVRVKWNTGLPPPVSGMMDDGVLVQRTLGLEDMSFLNSCTIYTYNGLPTLACLEKDSLAARFVRSYRLNSSGALTQVAPEISAPDVLGIHGVGSGVVTVKADGSYAGILGSAATGNVCQNGCPAGLSFALHDVLGFTGCGDSGPVLFAHYRDVITQRLTGISLLTGEKYAFAPPPQQGGLTAIGCVTDLEMGGAPRVAATATFVPNIFDRSSDRSAIYMVGSPDPVSRQRDRRLGTGFSTSGREARILTTEVDPNGFIVVESVLNRPAENYRLFERRRSPAVAPPRHYVSGAFDLDDGTDVVWDVFDDPNSDNSAVQILLAARPGRPALSGRLILTATTDLLTADLDGDGISEIIGYGLNTLAVQRMGAVTR